MNLDSITPEQRRKAAACKNGEELLALAKEEGVDLTDEQLDAIAGGLEKDWFGDYMCPKCGEEVNTYTDGTYWCPYCDARGYK